MNQILVGGLTNMDGPMRLVRLKGIGNNGIYNLCFYYPRLRLCSVRHANLATNPK
jgi:hypothetical protein